jgi:hypothetical protein
MDVIQVNLELAFLTYTCNGQSSFRDGWLPVLNGTPRVPNIKTRDPKRDLELEQNADLLRGVRHFNLAGEDVRLNSETAVKSNQ